MSGQECQHRLHKTTRQEVKYLYDPGTVGKGHDVPLFPEES